MSTKSIHTTAANVIVTTLKSLSSTHNKPITEIVSPDVFAYVVTLLYDKKINNQGVLKILEYCVTQESVTVDTIKDVITSLDVLQITDTNALQAVVDEVIASYQSQVEQYKNGKVQVIGYLVGQCMKASKGSGNPSVFKDLLTSSLS